MELVKTREPGLPATLQRREAHDARPPKHLSAASRRIWREMVAEWDFDGATLVILQTALEARDRMHQAREAIARDGLIVDSPQGTKAHPAIGIERDARVGLLRAWRQLGLDVLPPGQIGRPTEATRRARS